MEVMLVIFNGWVLTKLWMWFAVPFFHARPMSIAFAIGFSIIIRFFTYDSTIPRNKSKGWQEITIAFLTPYISGGFALLFGYIVSRYL
jgi:hypothetical protein